MNVVTSHHELKIFQDVNMKSGPQLKIRDPHTKSHKYGHARKIPWLRSLEIATSLSQKNATDFNALSDKLLINKKSGGTGLLVALVANLTVWKNQPPPPPPLMLHNCILKYEVRSGVKVISLSGFIKSWHGTITQTCDSAGHWRWRREGRPKLARLYTKWQLVY